MLTSLFETLACPNEGSNGNKRPKSFGSNTNDNVAAVCYKCQQAGHYYSGQCLVKIYITVLIFLA